MLDENVIIIRRIPLFRHPQEQTGARLSNILNYQTVPILTKVLTGNFFVTAPIVGLHN